MSEDDEINITSRPAGSVGRRLYANAPTTTSQAEGIVERLLADTCKYLGVPEKAVAECQEDGCSCALQVEAASLIERQQKEIDRLRTALEGNGSMDFFRDGAKHMRDVIASQQFHVDWGPMATPDDGLTLALDMSKKLANDTFDALLNGGSSERDADHKS